LDSTAAVGQHLEVWRDRWSILTDCPNLLPLYDNATVLLLTRAPRLAWSPSAGVVAGAGLCGASEWGGLVTWRRAEVGDDAGGAAALPGWRDLCSAAAWLVTAEVVLPSPPALPGGSDNPPPAWAFCVDGGGRVMTSGGLSVVHAGRPLSAEEHRRGLRLLLPLLVTVSMVRCGEARLERKGWAPWGPAFDVVPVRHVLHPEDRIDRGRS
jgi:hypothetical protein